MFNFSHGPFTKDVIHTEAKRARHTFNPITQAECAHKHKMYKKVMFKKI